MCLVCVGIKTAVMLVSCSNGKDLELSRRDQPPGMPGGVGEVGFYIRLTEAGGPTLNVGVTRPRFWAA